MKKIVVGAIALMLCYGFVLKSSTKKKQWTLQEVAKASDFSLEISYIGSSKASIAISSKLPHTTIVSIPAGTILIPEKEDEQTLVIPKDQLITLAPNERKEVNYSAYCTELNDRSPQTILPMSVGLTENLQLNKFFVYLKESKNISKSNMQEAIWCITDKQSIGNIYEAKSSNLKKTLSEITGRKIPWQSTKRSMTVTPERRIVMVPQKISGMINFTTTKVTYITSKVIKESGELVYAFDKEAKIPKGKTARLKFNLEIKGFEEGKYYVIYYTREGKELVKKEFTV